MYDTIKKMLIKAQEFYDKRDYDNAEELCEYIYNILNELATTINAPRDWRELGRDFALEFCETDVYELAKLYEF